jgi:signal transduction histidine kinase
LPAAAARTGRAGWTLRVRLTALYGAVFLVSGAVLLVITYALLAHRLSSSSVYVTARSNGSDTVVISQARPVGAIGLGPVGLPATPAQAQALFAQLQAAAERQRTDSLHQLVVESGVALAIMAVASMGLGWVVAGRALRPLRAMTVAARQISEHNLHERLPATGPRDELGDLAATFNALLGRLDRAFESQRQFVANASHELRTPLTLERAILEVSLTDPDADATSLRAACERVLAIGAQQEALIEALLTLARSQRGLDERRPVDLTAAAADAIDAGRAAAEVKRVCIETDLAPAHTVGDQRLVERLTGNLIDNAVRHNHVGGVVTVRTGTADGRAALSVVNTGPQIPADQLERLFQPFQRLDSSRTAHPDSLGVGLSIVAAIAAAHDAFVTARAQEHGGLRVDVLFPVPGQYRHRVERGT